MAKAISFAANSTFADTLPTALTPAATTINPEKAKFTSLPGVDRFISKLEGDMFLEHDKHYEVELEKYQIDRFKGDWETYSTGKFKDFNLMLKGVRGDLYFRELESPSKLHLEHNCNIAFLFLIEGDLSVNNIKLEENDFFYTDSNILETDTKNAKIFYGFIKEWD